MGFHARFCLFSSLRARPASHSIAFLRFRPKASDFCYTTKVTKSVAGFALRPSSAGSCSFESLSRGSASRATKPTGNELTNEERYIASQGAAVDGGGNVACAVKAGRPVAFRCVNVKSRINLRTPISFHCKRAQPDRRTSRRQSLHLIIAIPCRKMLRTMNPTAYQISRPPNLLTRGASP